MYPFLSVIAIGAGLLALSACEKTPPVLPTPIVDQAVPAPSTAQAADGTNTSVPPAGSVFPPASAAPAEPVPKPTDGNRRPALEADSAPLSLPLPGQNNDHSAPLSTGK